MLLKPCIVYELAITQPYCITQDKSSECITIIYNRKKVKTPLKKHINIISRMCVRWKNYKNKINANKISGDNKFNCGSCWKIYICRTFRQFGIYQ